MKPNISDKLNGANEELKKSLERLEIRENEIKGQMEKARNDMRHRLEKTFQRCNSRIYRCDFHAHSTYSDGRCDIDEIHQWMGHAGIDFMAITDHNTILQKADCSRYPDMWYGEEITTKGRFHHIVGLNISEKLNPEEMDIEETVQAVRKQGGFPVIAHPCGWYGNPYPPERIQVAEKIGGRFAIEIGNAADNIFDYFDETDEEAVRFWDKLLLEGKEVVGLGDTDEHHCYQIGVVWNGVICNSLTREKILEAVTKGHLFVSNGPIAILKMEEAMMGDAVYTGKGKLSFKVECYDDYGLYKIRIVKNGELFKELKLEEEKEAKFEFEDQLTTDFAYYRVECHTLDGKRAYSNPIRIFSENVLR